jgi:hypothetical protein
MKQNSLAILVLAYFALFSLTLTSSFASVITVDDDGPGDFNSIQAAIDSILISGTIEVSPGVYYENISYYGKSIVITSTEPNDPNVVELTVIDGNSLGNVVTLNNGEDESCELAGFTIQNGTAGIYCFYSEPLIRNCVVKFNTTGILGPGSPRFIETIVMENSTGIYDCDGDISDCNIVLNTVNGLELCDGNIYGCEITDNGANGLVNCDGIKEDCIVTDNGRGFYGSGGQVLNCEVTDNEAEGFLNCNGLVDNCIISGNETKGYSGNSSTVKNCLVSGNGSDGISLTGTCDVNSCTVVGNSGYGICLASNDILVVSDCIVVRNVGYGLRAQSGLVTSQYNNVWQNLQGNYSGLAAGPNDISQNPLFAEDGYWDMSDNWVEGEYHLKSGTGRWEAESQTWVIDDVNSPSIDAGDPCSPIGSEPNPNGGVINQGVYGGTAEASKSATGIIVPVCMEYTAMDFNKDCKVDFIDFAMFCHSWLECKLDPPSACLE